MPFYGPFENSLQWKLFCNKGSLVYEPFVLQVAVPLVTLREHPAGSGQEIRPHSFSPGFGMGFPTLSLVCHQVITKLVKNTLSKASLFHTWHETVFLNMNKCILIK